MRSVLVCVRTPVAAQTIATSAARLGLGSNVRTAITAGEALAQLATAPADLVLADTALSRPDSAEFTRLTVAPGTVLMLFGPEEPRIAAAAVQAGARGVIRGDTGDPVTVVTKALLLLLSHAATTRDASPPASRTPVPGTAAPMPNGPIASRSAAPAPRTTAQVPQPSVAAAPAVPQQRGDAVAEPPRRRVDLTERELQVLRGMADGKSNAEIGRELFVSEDTVKTHARRLFRKLGAADRAQAVAVGFRWGLVR